MAKGGSRECEGWMLLWRQMPRRIGAPPDLVSQGRWVSQVQAKLHCWAAADPDRRFDDLLNLVHNPATLAEAWARVARNRGARSAASDAVTVAWIERWASRCSWTICVTGCGTVRSIRNPCPATALRCAARGRWRGRQLRPSGCRGGRWRPPAQASSHGSADRRDSSRARRPALNQESRRLRRPRRAPHRHSGLNHVPSRTARPKP